MIRLILFIFIYSFLFSVEIPSHGDKKKWVTISESDEIWVGTFNFKGIDWARSESLLPYPIEKVQTIIENTANYPNVFKRLTEVYNYGDDIVHIVLDMPFPISNRDYIVKYETQTIKDGIRFQFFANNYSEAKDIKGCIRLINAAGEWNLVAIDGSTLLTYTWNGELRGDFPDFMLEKAWQKQGTEIIGWLLEKLDEEN